MSDNELIGSAYSPKATVLLRGVLSADPAEVEAVVDTGYGGVLAMPIDKAFPFGFPLIGEDRVKLGNGKTYNWLVGWGLLSYGDQEHEIPILLKPAGTKTCLGVEFLTFFKLDLLVRGAKVKLVEETMKAEISPLDLAGAITPQ